jgi:hypothetical protein
MATLPIPGLLTEFEVLALQALDFGVERADLSARVLHQSNQRRGGVARANWTGPGGRVGAAPTGPRDDSGEGGAARSRSNSETGTRRGVKQKMEAEPSSMVAQFNHLLWKLREPGTG